MAAEEEAVRRQQGQQRAGRGAPDEEIWSRAAMMAAVGWTHSRRRRWRRRSRTRAADLRLVAVLCHWAAVRMLDAPTKLVALLCYHAGSDIASAARPKPVVKRNVRILLHRGSMVACTSILRACTIVRTHCASIVYPKTTVRTKKKTDGKICESWKNQLFCLFEALGPL